MLERTPIKTEAELCAAFIQSMNKQADWTCYPEAAGFDILAVHTSGRQIGVEAKMSLNAKVADQILPKDYENFYGRPGPDHRLVIVGKASEASHGICRMLGLLGVPVVLPRWMSRGVDKSGWEFDVRCVDNRDWMSFFVNEEYLHLFDWNPAERCRVPMVVGAHQAGVPSPVSLTPWKEAALRVIALMRSQGHIAAKQIQKLGISPTAWTRPKGTDPGWLDRGPVRGTWIETENMPPFDKQHPEAYAIVVADLAAKAAPQLELTA